MYFFFSYVIIGNEADVFIFVIFWICDTPSVILEALKLYNQFENKAPSYEQVTK